MYEDRLGTEDDPIIVPSTEAERIIGVTDPDDDNLVVWGILKAADPPRQFVEGGEFYVLKEVRGISWSMSAGSRVVLQSICCRILLRIRYHLQPDLHDAGGACCLLPVACAGALCQEGGRRD